MREQINSKTFYMLDNENIKEIKMRKVGLLDVFGKIEIDVKIKKYKKKRFKKLLMAQGIQRNDAEIFASISEDEKAPIKRNNFGLILVKGILNK